MHPTEVAPLPFPQMHIHFHPARSRIKCVMNPVKTFLSANWVIKNNLIAVGQTLQKYVWETPKIGESWGPPFGLGSVADPL